MIVSREKGRKLKKRQNNLLSFPSTPILSRILSYPLFRTGPILSLVLSPCSMLNIIPYPLYPLSYHIPYAMLSPILYPLLSPIPLSSILCYTLSYAISYPKLSPIPLSSILYPMLSPILCYPQGYPLSYAIPYPML